jgi:hypothetical protein
MKKVNWLKPTKSVDWRTYDKKFLKIGTIENEDRVAVVAGVFELAGGRLEFTGYNIMLQEFEKESDGNERDEHRDVQPD